MIGMIFFSHNKMKNRCSKLYLTQAINTQNRAQQNVVSETVDGVIPTDILDQVIIKLMTLSLPGDPTVSADKTFWEAPCTSSLPVL
jgi:hypothetical protein